MRLPHGEYIEVHEPLDEFEMWKLVDFKTYQPTLARPNAQGKITIRARMRSSLSRFFFEDRIAPVTATELAAAHHDHAPAVEAKPAKKAVTSKKK